MQENKNGLMETQKAIVASVPAGEPKNWTVILIVGQDSEPVAMLDLLSAIGLHVDEETGRLVDSENKPPTARRPLEAGTQDKKREKWTAAEEQVLRRIQGAVNLDQFSQERAYELLSTVVSLLPSTLRTCPYQINPSSYSGSFTSLSAFPFLASIEPFNDLVAGKLTVDLQIPWHAQAAWKNKWQGMKKKQQATSVAPDFDDSWPNFASTHVVPTDLAGLDDNTEAPSLPPTTPTAIQASHPTIVPENPTTPEPAAPTRPTKVKNATKGQNTKAMTQGTRPRLRSQAKKLTQKSTKQVQGQDDGALEGNEAGEETIPGKGKGKAD